MGPQKITFGRKNTLTPEERAAAVNGADPSNNYMWGQQSAFRNFEEMAVARDQGGNNNNQAPSIPEKQTGLLGEFSSTQSPQQSPETMASEARIKMIAAGHQPPGLNNLEQIYRV